MKELYQYFIPGTLSWLDSNNNKAFLAGELGATNNGISVYYAAKNSEDAAVKAMSEDIFHQQMPIGPVGHPTELHLCTQAMLFGYSQYPNAAKEYLRFMYEKPQYEAWQNASLGYVAHPLDAYKDNAVWHDDPKALPYRDAVKNMLWNGFSGTLGYSSAAAMADYIVVDMFASVCSGDVTPAGRRGGGGEARQPLLPGLERKSDRGAPPRSAAPRDLAIEEQRAHGRPQRSARLPRSRRPARAGGRVSTHRNFVGFWFMLPAAAVLGLFLAYPLGLGVWLSMTDTHDRPRRASSSAWRISSISGTTASSGCRCSTPSSTRSSPRSAKFALGLWLALLLNRHLPFKAFIRAIVLLPCIVPTVLSAIAFWWIYDSQFSIISWALVKLGLIDSYIDFLGTANNARASTIVANIWRGIPFVAITLLAGLQTIPLSLYEAAMIDGATRLAALPLHHLPDADPDHRRGDDVLGALHLHRLPADLRADARRAAQRHAPDGDAVVPARHTRRRPRHRRGDRRRHDPVPARRDPVQLFRPAAPALAAGRRQIERA